MQNYNERQIHTHAWRGFGLEDQGLDRHVTMTKVGQEQ